MKRFVLVVTLAGIFVASQVNCFGYVDDTSAVYDAFTRARAVFIGEVTEIRKPVTSDPSAPLADRLYKVSFNVEYSWKGAGFQDIGAPGVFVLSAQGMDDPCQLMNGYSCFSWGSFSSGRKYLVYAEETDTKDLLVQYVSRTKPLFNASEDVKELQRMGNPIYGFRFTRVNF